jgi:hypothetical protein
VATAVKFTELEALAALARDEQEEQSENLTKPIGTNNPDCASHFQTAESPEFSVSA